MLADGVRPQNSLRADALRSNNCGQSDHEAWASFGAQAHPTRCASRHGQRGGGTPYGPLLRSAGCWQRDALALWLASIPHHLFGPCNTTASGATFCYSGRAQRRPMSFPRPSVCAWVGVLAGWRLHQRMQPLRDLAGRSCLNGARQRAVSSAAHPASAPTQVAPQRSEGVADSRVAFLLPTFLWRSKEK